MCNGLCYIFTGSIVSTQFLDTVCRMQPREGGGGRRLLLSSGVDRLMLNGINANLQHLRRQSRPSSQPLTNGDVGQVKPEAVQNGVGTKGPNKRLDYNRQAMREIGASIKGFHIDPNPNHVTSGSNGCSQSESFGRQVRFYHFRVFCDFCTSVCLRSVYVVLMSVNESLDLFYYSIDEILSMQGDIMLHCLNLLI